MIHIITVHFKTDEWIDVQLTQIDKHISDYKLWSYCDGFDISPHKHKFHFCENFSPTIKYRTGYLNHMDKLNSLTKVVMDDDETKDDDLLIWMDSDAFPVDDVNDYVVEKLSKYPLIAVHRLEHAREEFHPHPSFTCTNVFFWKKHKLNWDGVPGIIDDNNPMGLNKHGLHDPGGKLYQDLLENNIEWYRMRRTKSLTKHVVFFTIYDNLVYHHGAGSRGSTSYAAHEIFVKIKTKDIEYFGYEFGE